MEAKETLLREAFEHGCTVEEALCHAEMRKREWLEFLAKNSDFLNELEQMRLKPIVTAKMTAVKALATPKDAQWYLERKKKDEFSTKVENEHSGPGGKDLFPVLVKFLDAPPDNQPKP